MNLFLLKSYAFSSFAKIAIDFFYREETPPNHNSQILLLNNFFFTLKLLIGNYLNSFLKFIYVRSFLEVIVLSYLELTAAGIQPFFKLNTVHNN